MNTPFIKVDRGTFNNLHYEVSVAVDGERRCECDPCVERRAGRDREIKNFLDA